MTQYNLGNALSDQALAAEGAARARLLGEAVQAYRSALEVFTRETLPWDWAMTQRDLALALDKQALAMTGTARLQRLEQAVAAMRDCLTVYTADADPKCIGKS